MTPLLARSPRRSSLAAARTGHCDVPEDIFEMALEPFTTEVLLKLAEDRKVGFELNAGKKKWFLNDRAWMEEVKNYA